MVSMVSMACFFKPKPHRGLQPRHQDPSFLSLLIHGSNDPPGQGLEPLGSESEEKKYQKNPRLPSWGG